MAVARVDFHEFVEELPTPEFVASSPPPTTGLTTDSDRSRYSWQGFKRCLTVATGAALLAAASVGLLWCGSCCKQDEVLVVILAAFVALGAAVVRSDIHEMVEQF